MLEITVVICFADIWDQVCIKNGTLNVVWFVLVTHTVDDDSGSFECVSPVIKKMKPTESHVNPAEHIHWR